MSKKILILNGSPRSKGNTAMLCEAFSAGAQSAGHQVTRFDLHKLDDPNLKGEPFFVSEK